MYTLMSYEATLISECLITHITGIWTLTARYAELFIQSNLGKTKYKYWIYPNRKKNHSETKNKLNK